MKCLNYVRPIMIVVTLSGSAVNPPKKRTEKMSAARSGAMLAQGGLT